MKKVLPRSELIELVSGKRCAAFAPPLRTQPIQDLIIRSIEGTINDIATTDPAAQFVGKVLSQFRHLILPDYQERLAEVDIYVSPQQEFGAVANYHSNSIVMFDGLFQVLTFRIELTLLIAELKKKVSALADKIGLSEQEFPSVVLQAQSLSLHFLKHPEPLPCINVQFDERLRQQSHFAFSGALLFTLFHELGHLVLKHRASDGGVVTPGVPALACEEDVNIRKSHEFEADAFAFQAFVPEARGMIIVNVWFIMSLHLDLESLAGPRGDTHPFTINRVHHLNALAGALEDPIIGASAQSLFESRLTLMKKRLAAIDPREHLLSASDRNDVNEQAMRNVLGGSESCRAAVYRLLEAYAAVQKNT